jgi:hypothetical protein
MVPNWKNIGAKVIKIFLYKVKKECALTIFG